MREKSDEKRLSNKIDLEFGKRKLSDKNDSYIYGQCNVNIFLLYHQPQHHQSVSSDDVLTVLTEVLLL